MSAGHAPFPRARLLSWSCLPPRVFGELRRSRVYWVDARPPCRSTPGCRNTRTLRLRGVPTAAHPNARERREFPSQVWALLHSFTDITPHGPGGTEMPDPTMLRPRFHPLQRLAGREEPLDSSGIPTRWLRCVPRVSHPLDALLPPRPAGLVSSRFRSWGSPSRLVPARCRYALSDAGPLGFLARSFRTTPPLQGSAQCAEPARGLRGLAGRPRRCLHGFRPSEVSCGGRRGPNDQPASPLALLRVDRCWPSRRRPRVSTFHRAADLSRDRRCLHGVLHLVVVSTLRSDSGTWVYRFPSVPGPRRRRSRAPLRPSSRPCRSSSRQPFR
jgi:hypothetical protein